jgi:hypothetical protein
MNQTKGSKNTSFELKPNTKNTQPQSLHNSAGENKKSGKQILNKLKENLNKNLSNNSHDYQDTTKITDENKNNKIAEINKNISNSSSSASSPNEKTEIKKIPYINDKLAKSTSDKSEIITILDNKRDSSVSRNREKSMTIIRTRKEKAV